MAGKRARKIRESYVRLNYFDRLMPSIERLHDVGTHRVPAIGDCSSNSIAVTSSCS